MFNKKIRDTTLTREIVDDYLPIKGDRFGGDESFVATLRALLHERSQGEEVVLYIYSDVWTPDLIVTDYPRPEDLFEFLHSTPSGDKSSIKVIGVTGRQANIDKVLSMYDDPENGFFATYPEYPEAEDLRAFVRNRARLNARFYVGKSGRETIIVCENLNLPAYHLLQSLVPRLLPQFFAEAPLDADELALLEALTLRTATEYERCLSKLAERLDLREFTIKRIIGDFEKAGRREEICRTQQKIARYKKEVADLRERYCSYLWQIDDLNVQLSGQETALNSASDGSELIDYFVHNRHITPLRVSGRVLVIAVKTFLESFDPEQFRTYSQNSHSFLYEGYECGGRFADIKNREKMLNAIFSDESTLKVKICSNYSLDLRGSGSCSLQFHYDDEFSDYLPNPHIHYFACLGNYAMYIDQALQNGDIIGAIEQCVASAKSLNLAESPTVRRFLNDMFNSRRNIIRLPDGKDVTPEEALDYLDDLEKKEENGDV